MEIDKRIELLDYARILCVFLVVYAHFYMPDTPERLYIYAFHMPLFFFVSGILHKQRSLKVGFEKYTKTLLIPFLYFTIVYICANSLWRTIVSESNDFFLYRFASYVYVSIKHLFLGLILDKQIPNEPVWFLLSLFYCHLALDLMLKKRNLFLIVYLSVFVLALYIGKLPFFIDAGLMAFPFFALGYYVKDIIKLFSNISVYRSVFLSIILFFCSLLISNYNGKISMFSFVFGVQEKFLSVLLFYVNALIGIIGVLFIANALQKMFKNTNLHIRLRKMSPTLISIVGFQAFWIEFFISFFGENMNNVLCVFITILTWLLCMFMHKVTTNYYPFLVGQRT